MNVSIGAPGAEPARPTPGDTAAPAIGRAAAAAAAIAGAAAPSAAPPTTPPAASPPQDSARTAARGGAKPALEFFGEPPSGSSIEMLGKSGRLGISPDGSFYVKPARGAAPAAPVPPAEPSSAAPAPAEAPSAKPAAPAAQPPAAAPEQPKERTGWPFGMTRILKI